MKATLKTALKSLFISFGGVYILRSINQTPRIVFWHSIDDIREPEVEAESITIETFKKQIEYLQDNFEIISMDEFYDRFQNQNFNSREIVLTFDDGYANNLNVVAPYLNSKKLPFTVFISTEHIETGELFPTSIARLICLGANLKMITIPQLNIDKFDISEVRNKKIIYKRVIYALKTAPLHEVKKIVEELKHNLSKAEYFELIERYKSVKPMNWGDVKQLHQLGATIGSHCKYHICCHDNQNIEEVKEQVFESKVILEEKLQSKCEFFAYPNGDFTVESNQLIIEAGYKMGFSVEKERVGINNNIAVIPRIGVPQSLSDFKILTALYPKK